MIATIPGVTPITTTAVLLFRNLGSGNRTFDFGCGADLSSCGIVMAEGGGEFWLRPSSQDLFSARVLSTYTE